MKLITLGECVVIDVHCDLLYQLWRYGYDVNQSNYLQFDLKKWRSSPVKVQAFAIFVPDNIPVNKQYDVALEMIELFYQKIIYPNPDIILIQSKADLSNLQPHQLGAILTLEGCHPIGTDLTKLIRLINDGVRIVGLTWNNNNVVSDSIMSSEGKGVSPFGEEMIQLLNHHSIWTDVSHVSVKGFYDVIELADHVIASHSNAYHICPHRRNLTDHQIKSIIERDGLIGVTFVPEFTKNARFVSIDDLFLHIDYFIELGAENHLCFGSDFDGITDTIYGLENVTSFQRLKKGLFDQYSHKFVNKISAKNFIDKFPRIN